MTWRSVAVAFVPLLLGAGDRLESYNCAVQFALTPCRTVRSHEVHTEGNFGLQSIVRVDSVLAINRDGSEYSAIQSTHRRFWFFTDQPEARVELVLRKQNRIVQIDHNRKIFTTSAGGAFRGYQVWDDDDPQCTRAKSQYWYLSDRVADSMIAGVPVVSYKGRDGDHIDYLVSFAPSLGCEQMRFVMNRRGFAGWTTSTFDSVVDSYEIGPPTPGLFAIPAGYKQISREQFERLSSKSGER